jgi:hypothetical protein
VGRPPSLREGAPGRIWGYQDTILSSGKNQGLFRPNEQLIEVGPVTSNAVRGLLGYFRCLTGESWTISLKYRHDIKSSMRRAVPMDKERPPRDDFSQAEAEAKVGRHVRSLVAFAGVARGTTGLVVSADLAGWTKPVTGEKAEVYDVAIQWDLPRPAAFADRVITGREKRTSISRPASHWWTGLPRMSTSASWKKSRRKGQTLKTKPLPANNSDAVSLLCPTATRRPS